MEYEPSRGLVIVDSNPDWSSEDHSQKHAERETGGEKRECDSEERSHEERQNKQKNTAITMRLRGEQLDADCKDNPKLLLMYEAPYCI